LRTESAFGVRSTGVGAAKVFPFYVVCDVSRSMWDPDLNDSQPVTPLNVVEDSLPDMLTALEEDPTALETAYLGIVAFGDSPVLVLPLTPLADEPAIPVLPRQAATNYVEVFKFLDRQLRSDQERLISANLGTYNPVVFFLTDGNAQVGGHIQKESRWLPLREALDFANHPFHPVIVALGIGDVEANTVRNIRSTRPRGVACVAEGNAIPGDLLRAIIGSIIFSITKSVGQGEFEFKIPAGMRKLD
jgi:uncharacterized protein YegL